MASLRNLFNPLYEDAEVRENRHHKENLEALRDIADQLRALLKAIQKEDESNI